MNRQTIYISAYPKSGSTWLTRLLADVLNSQSGGCMPSEDSKEVAAEGENRPGPYIVRKGHFVLIDDEPIVSKRKVSPGWQVEWYVDDGKPGRGPVVPRPHRLAWKRLTDEKIVFLVRDPRDICVSGAWHWRQKPEVFLERMIKGDVARCGRWDMYVDSWERAHQKAVDYYGLLVKPLDNLVIVKYENLLQSTYCEIVHILADIEMRKNANGLQILEAIKRQSFKSRKAQIGDNPAELRRNNMRKGVVGDWRNHFTPEMNDRIWDEFGWIMERLGYER